MSRIRKYSIAVVGFALAALLSNPNELRAAAGCDAPAFGQCSDDYWADVATCDRICPGWTGFQCMQWPPVNGPYVLACFKDPI